MATTGSFEARPGPQSDEWARRWRRPRAGRAAAPSALELPGDSRVGSRQRLLSMRTYSLEHSGGDSDRPSFNEPECERRLGYRSAGLPRPGCLPYIWVDSTMPR